MYVCMYMYTCVRKIYIHINICIYTYTYVRIHVHILVLKRGELHIIINVCIYIFKWAVIHVCLYADIYLEEHRRTCSVDVEQPVHNVIKQPKIQSNALRMCTHT